MTTLDKQLAWEHDMVYRGITRYRDQQKEAVAGDRAHETSAGSRLLKSYVLQISAHIKAYLAGELPGRRRKPEHKLMLGVSPDAIAMFTLRAVIGSMFVGDTRRPSAVVSVANTIGQKIEDELRFAEFSIEHQEYYDTVMRTYKARHTANYRYMHASLSQLAKNKGMEWRAWTIEEKMLVGTLAIALMMESCDLTEIKRARSRLKGQFTTRADVVATQECLDWIASHDSFTELTHPDRMPCLMEPAPWTSPFDGGFWSARMRHNTPLIKRVQTSAGTRASKVAQAIMPRVLRAVNGLQDTPWRVNTAIHDTLKLVFKNDLEIGLPRSTPYVFPVCPLSADLKVAELPVDSPIHQRFNEWRCATAELHTMESVRKSKNRAVIRTLRLAQEMRQHEEFYYVYQCDFRGRIYCATTGLSPQGTDPAKALLKFGRSVPLGVRGLFWLKVHGANKYGYDKVSYTDRVKWVDQHHEWWMAIAANPIEHSNAWKDADKPWQFLAFVFEYAAAMEYGEGYRSSLPVALDGSCNGLQHFSAMLRDPVGGAAVNLVPADTPHDIYQQVADVATQKLRTLTTQPGDNAGAHNWLRLWGEDGMPRKLSKRPVMTLPYGSTPNACTSAIFQWIQDEHPKFFPDNTDFRHALYLSPILWASISQVVVAARTAMDWIQRQTTQITKHACPLEYNTALGFPVYQAAKKMASVRIRTQIGGNLLVTYVEPTPELDRRKQRQGSSPNLIHSVDATHLMMVVNAGLDTDIDCFAMIHDDFGVHAAHIDRWQELIRQTFVKLHEPADILPNFKAAHELSARAELEPLPPLQTLDLHDVLTSPYFFG